MFVQVYGDTKFCFSEREPPLPFFTKNYLVDNYLKILMFLKFCSKISFNISTSSFSVIKKFVLGIIVFKIDSKKI